MKFSKRNFSLIFLVTLFLIASFGFGFWAGKVSVVCKVCPPEDLNFSLFWEAWHKLQDKYVNQNNFNIQKIIYGAISGMVKSLEDPYTVFFNPEETKKFLEDVSGRFEGIGVEIGIKKGQLQVIAPIEGTPAQRAGLRAGDKIFKINDILTVDMEIEEAVSLIRGPKGIEVTLTISRKEWDVPKEIKIKRAIIEVPSLNWELKEGNIAYIRINHFSENTKVDFIRVAWEILNSPAKKIAMDLRNNPGGYLEVARDIAGWFLKKEEVVVIEDFGGKREKEIYKADGNSKFADYPMVILINQGSASASEILASALRDNRGMKIIGETSFGKGSVQELEKLRDDSGLKITVAKWLTPKGNQISDKGLEPDIKIQITEEDYEKERDPQLEKAIEALKEM